MAWRLQVRWHHLCLLLAAVADYSVDAAHRGHVLLVTHTLGEKLVANLPGEHARIGGLVLLDSLHHTWRCYFGLTATDYTRLDTSSFIIAAGDKRIGGRQQ